jgi:uncharacterized protein (TIGR04141 family)
LPLLLPLPLFFLSVIPVRESASPRLTHHHEAGTSGIEGFTIELPPYADSDERRYNLRVSEENGYFCCMDRQTVEVKKRGLTKIEFCDLYGRDGEMIHIKRYAGSSELSHLFQQGVVSAELFSHEPEFRLGVNNKLPRSHKLEGPEGKLDPTK